ncbi:MAG TPA: hypothetical protein VG122_04245 [Gemmata sp.]|jgi:hypothetical protein|nr:hypothetical protein [Gemmata sp.]
MSTAVPVTPSSPSIPPEELAPPGATAERAIEREKEKEIRVYGHSSMFYWWPVWVVGFLMAALTYADGHVFAVVPQGTQMETDQIMPGDQRPREVLVVPPGQTVPPLPGAKEGELSPRLRMAANNNYGVVFVGVLLLVIVVSNYIFRGLVSIIVVAGMAVIVLLFALLKWWDPILAWLGGLDIRMNAEGYLAIAIPLFCIWVFTTFIYDHYTYIIVTQGQVRIRESIGDGEIAVDSSGLLLNKRRNDLFRHWLIGLGAGDLHLKTGGPANIDFELPNVLFIGTKLGRIQDLLREKEVETTPAR